jgi:hypothetical protein
MAGFRGITKRHRPLPQHLYAEPVRAVKLDAADRAPGVVTFMDSAAVRGAYIAVLLVLTLLMVGSWDYADALAAEARAKEELAARVIEESLAEFTAVSHPLPYAATMRHCSAAWRECSDIRHYVPKGGQ